ncbi:hypothetical protein [Brachybacterium sp. p3-SID957]|uniref:hypothetical protein n=1 Tax=Brachybacterium sp. p3-SID957 TaxID=2916049 RepID=UPI00223B7E11|nr:hypothetical protein [Brachybacterium sp. p3-SID957]MCT1774748.1 hypothetical protein [Brachybacterium sp. p3-SID957]
MAISLSDLPPRGAAVNAGFDVERSGERGHGSVEAALLAPGGDLEPVERSAMT